MLAIFAWDILILKIQNVIGKTKNRSTLTCCNCLFIVAAAWSPKGWTHPIFCLLPGESHSGCSQFPHHKLLWTVLHMSPRLHVSKVLLNYKWTYLVIKHRNVKLYCITKQLPQMAVSIYSHTMALLKGKKVTFCNSMLSFWDSSPLQWWMGLVPNQLLRFDKDGSHMRNEISRKASSFPNVIVLPGCALYLCPNFWIFLGTRAEV